MRLATALALGVGVLSAVSGLAADVFVPDNAPWFILKAGESSGLAVDVIALLAARSGLRLEARGIPLARIGVRLAQSQQGGFAVFARPETLPVHVVELGDTLDIPLLAIASRGEPDPTLDRLRQLGGVGLVHGAARLLPPDLVRGIPVREMPDIMSGLKMIETGRVDAMLLTQVEADLISPEQKQRLRLGTAVQVGVLHIMLASNESIAGQAEARQLEGAWNACLRDGSIARLLAAGGGAD